VERGPGGMILCSKKFDGLQGRLSDHVQWRVPTVRRSVRDRRRRRHRYAEYLKRRHHTEPPSRPTEQPAANSALPPNDWTEPERLQLTVELSGRTIAVQAEETDWEWAAGKGPRTVSGAWAVEWTVVIVGRLTTLKLIFRRWLQKFQHHKPTYIDKDTTKGRP
jgi:hypothetical protein